MNIYSSENTASILSLSSRFFVVNVFLINLLVFSCFLGAGIFWDEFGLFSSSDKNSKRIFALEKTTKYLFSHRYVPDHYDSYFFGSSSGSLHVDMGLMEGGRFYNMSLNNGNVSESLELLKVLLDKKDHEIKNIVICVTPSYLANTSVDQGEIGSQVYYASIASTFVFKYFYYKLKNRIQGNDVFYSSYDGHTDIYKAMPSFLSTPEIDAVLRQLDEHKPWFPTIEGQGFSKLREIAILANEYGVRSLVYIYPFPLRIAQHENFRHKLDSMSFEVQSISKEYGMSFMNFNDSRYADISSVDSNYYNTNHLSREGAVLLLNGVNRAIKGSE